MADNGQKALIQKIGLDERRFLEWLLIYSGTFGGPLDPSNSPEVLKETEELGSWDRVLIDATWPFEWEAREEWGGLKHPPECRAEPDIVEKVLKRWSEYGLAIPIPPLKQGQG